MLKIKISRPTSEELKAMDVDSWSLWSCDPEEFDWQYPDDESAYVHKGHVVVTCFNGEEVEIKTGDMVVFPKGLKCRWKVIERIEKVYRMGVMGNAL